MARVGEQVLIYAQLYRKGRLIGLQPDQFERKPGKEQVVRADELLTTCFLDPKQKLWAIDIQPHR